MKKVYLSSLALLYLTSASIAHEWYDPWCCNTKDCAPIPYESVTATDNGWHIILDPGDHPLVTERQEFLVPYDKEGDYVARHRTSKDEQFHACLYPDQSILRCFYTPVMGF